MISIFSPPEKHESESKVSFESDDMTKKELLSRHFSLNNSKLINHKLLDKSVSENIGVYDPVSKIMLRKGVGESKDKPTEITRNLFDDKKTFFLSSLDECENTSSVLSKANIVCDRKRKRISEENESRYSECKVLQNSSATGWVRSALSRVPFLRNFMMSDKKIKLTQHDASQNLTKNMNFVESSNQTNDLKSVETKFHDINEYFHQYNESVNLLPVKDYSPTTSVSHGSHLQHQLSHFPFSSVSKDIYDDSNKNNGICKPNNMVHKTTRPWSLNNKLQPSSKEEYSRDLLKLSPLKSHRDQSTISVSSERIDDILNDDFNISTTKDLNEYVSGIDEEHDSEYILDAREKHALPVLSNSLFLKPLSPGKIDNIYKKRPSSQGFSLDPFSFFAPGIQNSNVQKVKFNYVDHFTESSSRSKNPFSFNGFISNESLKKKRGLSCLDYRRLIRQAKYHPCKWIDYFEYTKAKNADKEDKDFFNSNRNSTKPKTNNDLNNIKSPLHTLIGDTNPESSDYNYKYSKTASIGDEILDMCKPKSIVDTSELKTVCDSNNNSFKLITKDSESPNTSKKRMFNPIKNTSDKFDALDSENITNSFFDKKPTHVSKAVNTKINAAPDFEDSSVEVGNLNEKIETESSKKNSSLTSFSNVNLDTTDIVNEKNQSDVNSVVFQNNLVLNETYNPSPNNIESTLAGNISLILPLNDTKKKNEITSIPNDTKVKEDCNTNTSTPFTSFVSSLQNPINLTSDKPFIFGKSSFNNEQTTPLGATSKSFEASNLNSIANSSSQQYIEKNDIMSSNTLQFNNFTNQNFTLNVPNNRVENNLINLQENNPVIPLPLSVNDANNSKSILENQPFESLFSNSRSQKSSLLLNDTSTSNSLFNASGGFNPVVNTIPSVNSTTLLSPAVVQHTPLPSLHPFDLSSTKSNIYPSQGTETPENKFILPQAESFTFGCESNSNLFGNVLSNNESQLFNPVSSSLFPTTKPEASPSSSSSIFNPSSSFNNTVNTGITSNGFIFNPLTPITPMSNATSSVSEPNANSFSAQKSSLFQFNQDNTTGLTKTIMTSANNSTVSVNPIPPSDTCNQLLNQSQATNNAFNRLNPSTSIGGSNPFVANPMSFGKSAPRRPKIRLKRTLN